MFQILCLLFSLKASAEISGTSLFKETKSINPAVVSGRRESVISVSGSKEQIAKSQSLNENYGNSDVKIEVDMNRLTSFYGGKAGGGITTELFIDISSGAKKTSVSSESSESVYSNNIDFALAIYSLSFSKSFGISLGYLKSSFAQNNEGTSGSYTYKIKNKMNTDAILFRAGSSTKIFGLDFGYYGEAFRSQNAMYDDQGEERNQNNIDYRAGVAIGSSGPNHLFELAYEKQLFVDTSLGAYAPQRFSITLETGFGGIVLGYTGRMYIDAYGEIENLMYNNLVYSGNTKTRLQHIFNFSLGREKGSSISGSIYFSKGTNQEDNLLDAGGMDSEKFDTKSEEKGVSLKYSYTF